jgi:hypothetical protein
VVKNSGDSWWVAGHEEHKSSGRTRFVRWLSTNLEACNEIELECRANIEIFE